MTGHNLTKPQGEQNGNVLGRFAELIGNTGQLNLIVC